MTRDEKRFNKSLSIFAILLRKQDSAEKQFNNIMSYLKVDKQATSADVEAIKETENDADDEDQ